MPFKLFKRCQSYEDPAAQKLCAQILFQSGILIAKGWYYAESRKVVVCNIIGGLDMIGLVMHVLCTIRSKVCTSSCDPSLPLSDKELGNGWKWDLAISRKLVNQ